MATGLHWWVISPAGMNQGSALDPTVPQGTIIISLQIGSADDKSLSGGQGGFLGIGTSGPGAITYNGQQYIAFMGPFPTKQAAESAKPPSGIGAIGAIIAGSLGAASTLNPLLAGAAATANAAQSAGTATGTAVPGLSDFFNNLTQANTWLRVAEGILGIMLIAVAIGKMTGTDNLISSTIKKRIL